MEFWNSQLTEKSWTVLQEIRKKHKFILIGGWAAYLWTRQQKSKDIDIIVDIQELQKLKKENLSKNDNLKKYEIKTGEIDVDIYVPHFSKLTIPLEDMKNYTSEIEGFTVASKEVLLILKQGAEKERGNSVKGEKDQIDIVSLLFFSDIDFNKYKTILKKYRLEFYIDWILSLLRAFSDYNCINMTPREFKQKKMKLINEIRKL